MAGFPDWLDPSTLPPGYQPSAGETPYGLDPYGTDPNAALAAGGYGAGQPPVTGAPPNTALPGNQLIDPSTGVQAGVPDAMTGAAPPTPFVPGAAPPPSMQPDGSPRINSGAGVGDEQQAVADQANSFNKYAETAQGATAAQGAAADAHQKALTKAWNDSADKYTQAQDTLAMAREASHRQASAENAQWAKDMDAQAAKMPDHSHWWESQSGFGKALYLAGLAFSTYGQSKVYGAKNPAADMMMKAIDDDMSAQKDRLARQTQTMRENGTQMRSDQRDKLSDIQDSYAKKIMKIEMVRQALIEQSKQAGPEDRKAALLAGAASLEGEKTKILTARVEQTHREQQGAMDRVSREKTAAESDWTSRSNNRATIAGENTRQGLELTDKDKLHAADIAKDFSLAGMKLDEKGNVTGGPVDKDSRGVSQDLGLSMVDKDTGKPIGNGDFIVHKDDKAPEKAGSLAQAANQRMSDLRYVKKSISDDSFATLILAKDPALTARIVRLAYTTAQENEPGGKKSDNDISYALKENFGFDALGGGIDKAKLALNKDKVLMLIQSEMDNMPAKVSKELTIYNDTLRNGTRSKLIWTPQSVEAPDRPTETITGALAAAGHGGRLEVPASPEAFRKAQATEDQAPEFKGQVMVPYDEQKVRDLNATFKGASPDHIKVLADEALKTLEGNQDRWNGSVHKKSESDITTASAIQVAAEDASKKSAKRIQDAEDYLRSSSGFLAPNRGALMDHAGAIEAVEKKFGLTNLDHNEWAQILEAAGVK